VPETCDGAQLEASDMKKTILFTNGAPGRPRHARKTAGAIVPNTKNLIRTGARSSPE